MQFRDLKTQYQRLKPEIDEAMTRVVTHCNFISGVQVAEFETELAEFVGVKHCITCANGTDALTLAMMAWGIGPGDAVFVPDFTFFSSGEIVALAGATPIFVDVYEDTYNIDCEHLISMIDKVKKQGKFTPKAIVAVDLFGLPAYYMKLRNIAKENNLLLLEDGAVFTNNNEWAELIKSYRIHGKGESKYDNVRVGLNSRLDTLQAAILQVKLKAFKEYELSDVNRVAAKYDSHLRGLNLARPVIEPGFYSSWAQYTIRLENRQLRDGLQTALKAAGIPSMIYYQKPMHKQEAFNTSIYDDAEYPVTNRLCQTVLSLPIHPYLQDEDVERVCRTITDFLK